MEEEERLKKEKEEADRKKKEEEEKAKYKDAGKKAQAADDKVKAAQLNAKSKLQKAIAKINKEKRHITEPDTTKMEHVEQKTPKEIKRMGSASCFEIQLDTPAGLVL